MLLSLPVTPVSIDHKLSLVTSKNHYFPGFAFRQLHDYAMLCVCGSDEVLCFSPSEESLPGENLLSRLYMLWITLGSKPLGKLHNTERGKAKSCFFFSTGNKKYLLQNTPMKAHTLFYSDWNGTIFLFKGFEIRSSPMNDMGKALFPKTWRFDPSLMIFSLFWKVLGSF